MLKTTVRFIIDSCRDGRLPLHAPRADIVEGSWITIKRAMHDGVKFLQEVSLDEEVECVCDTLRNYVEDEGFITCGHLAAAGCVLARTPGTSKPVQDLLMRNAKEPLWPHAVIYLEKIEVDVMKYLKCNHVGTGPLGGNRAVRKLVRTWAEKTMVTTY